MLRSIIRTAFLLPLGLGLMFVLFALLARVLSPSDYGVLSLVFSIASIVAVLLCAGLPISATKFIPEYIAKNYTDNIAGFLRFGTWWVVLFACAITVLMFGVSQYLSDKNLHTIFLCLAMTIPSIMFWQWQRYASLGFDFIEVAIIPRDILFPLFGIIGLKVFGIVEVVDVFIMLNAIYMSCVIGGFFALYRRLPAGVCLSKGDVSASALWIKTSFPMVLTTLVQLGLNNWDIILLGLLTTMEDTGIYAVATRVAMLVSLILRVLETTVIQKISKLFASEEYSKMKEMYQQAMLLSGMVSLVAFSGLLLFLDEILDIFGEHYHQAYYVAIIIALGHLISSCIGPSMSSLNMIGREQYVAKLMVKWSIIAFVLNLMLIPIMGIYGAAVTFLICLSALKVQQYIELRKVFSDLINE